MPPTPKPPTPCPIPPAWNPPPPCPPPPWPPPPCPPPRAHAAPLASSKPANVKNDARNQDSRCPNMIHSSLHPGRSRCLLSDSRGLARQPRIQCGANGLSNL